MAPMLATALALAIAAPVRADDDDDDDDRGRRGSCPCWSEGEARRAVRAAFAEVGSENFVCDSEIDARGIEEFANADFVVFDGPFEEPGQGRELDLEASLLTVEREVERAFCSVEDIDGFRVREDQLTRAEAKECVEILGEICLDAKSARRDDDDDDHDDDDDDDDDDDRKRKKKGKARQ
jgi:hypothetical protein